MESIHVRLQLIIFFFITPVFLPGTATGDALPGTREFNWQKAYFFNFYDVSPLESGDVWIVGSKGMICAFDHTARKWIIQESKYSRNLYNVVFPEPSTGSGWITGQNGTILHTENRGKTWIRQKSGTTEHLFGLTFIDKHTGWAVGAYGTILHTSNGGKAWEKQGDQVDRIYNGVSFADTEHGWIVGEFGVILHTRDGGKNWLEQTNPLGEKTLFSVYFINRYTGYASGMDGAIIQTRNGGKTWTSVDSKIKENLFSITARENRQWAVGLKGTFSKKMNGEWRDATESIPTRAWLKKCAFIDTKTGWIVGSVGTVLRTVDGGETWVPAAQAH